MRNRILTALALATALLPTLVLGAQRAAVQFEIGSAPVSVALKQFVQQSDLQILYASDMKIEALPAQPVAGELAPDEGLDALLEGTGLAYEFVNVRTVAIHLADPAAKEVAYKGMPEILIQGSRTTNADIERAKDDVRPYVVIDRHAIEKSGVSNVDNLLKAKPRMDKSALTKIWPGADIFRNSGDRTTEKGRTADYQDEAVRLDLAARFMKSSMLKNWIITASLLSASLCGTYAEAMPFRFDGAPVQAAWTLRDSVELRYFVDNPKGSHRKNLQSDCNDYEFQVCSYGRVRNALAMAKEARETVTNPMTFTAECDRSAIASRSADEAGIGRVYRLCVSTGQLQPLTCAQRDIGTFRFRQGLGNDLTAIEQTYGGGADPPHPSERLERIKVAVDWMSFWFTNHVNRDSPALARI